ncbi:hypothetical protein EDB89DRAFT_1901978 [Lactarius sanguifluus]|nr:hypothetical protein EDB89DRAFT_1901978 [Lactarius sanguifluus]
MPLLLLLCMPVVMVKLDATTHWRGWITILIAVVTLPVAILAGVVGTPFCITVVGSLFNLRLHRRCLRMPVPVHGQPWCNNTTVTMARQRQQGDYNNATTYDNPMMTTAR